MDGSRPRVYEAGHHRFDILRPKGDFFELESDSPIAVGVTRAAFDNLLVEKAVAEGANFESGRRVTGISTSSEGVKVAAAGGREVTAKVVVGADGVNGVVAKLSGIRSSWHPSEVAQGLVTEMKVGTKVVKEISQDSSLEFYFGIGRTGYGWIFPKGDYLNIGVGQLLSEQRNSRKLYESFIQSRPQLQSFSSPQSHLLPVGGIHRRTYTNRTLLIGDAAGFVDPLSGEGIFYAISSAKKAAKCIIENFEKNAFSADALHQYERSCEISIMTELRHAYSFAKKIHYHPNMMLGFFILDQGLRMKFLSVLKGETTYKQFTRYVYSRIPFTILRRISSLRTR